jgi:hypothetical protein
LLIRRFEPKLLVIFERLSPAFSEKMIEEFAGRRNVAPVRDLILEHGAGRVGWRQEVVAFLAFSRFASASCTTFGTKLLTSPPSRAISFTNRELMNV